MHRTLAANGRSRRVVVVVQGGGRRQGNLLAVAEGQIMAAQIEYKDSGIQVRTPEAVLQAGIEMVIFEPYDVTRDGKKFVVNTLSDMEGPLTLMVNWTARVTQ